ncbi:MAG: glycerol kinase GlpK [Candidatus Cloacimonetes bacterium]|nr:glycerol kinase GlpK [Candidatus Cloacimonadota bacterium]
MAEKFIAALDLGTTSVRLLLFNHSARKVTGYQIEHKQYFPQAGWVEHDAEEIWQNTCKIITETLSVARKHNIQIVALGITNQRETLVVWDKATGKPLYRAIVWQDTRTREIVNKLAKEHSSEYFQQRTGLPPSTYFSAPKLLWLMEKNPDLRGKLESGSVLVGTIDSWIVWKLTGKHITDVTNASRTMLMNIRELVWDDELLKIFGIPINCLPVIVSSVISNPPLTFGDSPFQAEIPVAGILGDQQAALFGQTCFNNGEAKNTYGTGCFLLTHTGSNPVFSKNGLLTTVAAKVGEEPATYALEGSVAVAGSAIQWLRDNIGLIKQSTEAEELAVSVDSSRGLYFVPAFTGLFAPWWNPGARGILCGLTHFHTKAHIVRAVLEATAFQTHDVFEAMQKDSGASLSSLKVDGGMTTNNLLMQFQADILNMEVVLPEETETTALGAAFAAGLAVGFWQSRDELRSLWKVSQKWQPRMTSTECIKRIASWHKAIKKSLDWEEEDE